MSKFASPGAQISALERESGYLHIADGHHKADDRQQLIEMGVTDRHDQSKAMGIYERATLIKKRLQLFRKELMELVRSDPKDPEQVFQLNIGFFPMSREKVK